MLAHHGGQNSFFVTKYFKIRELQIKMEVADLCLHGIW